MKSVAAGSKNAMPWSPGMLVHWAFKWAAVPRAFEKYGSPVPQYTASGTPEDEIDFTLGKDRKSWS